MKDDFLSLNHMGKKIILSSLYVAPDAWVYYKGKSSPFVKRSSVQQRQ